MFHMFQVIYAHEWMNDDHDHEMQVQLGKTNTRGVTIMSSSSTYKALHTPWCLTILVDDG